MNPPAPVEARANGRYCIVVSRFNAEVTDALVESARSCLVDHGAAPDSIQTVHVPGAWELPLAVKWAVERGDIDGVIALGCVIRGETPHFEYVSMGATIGLEAVARESGIPVAFGLLTTDDGDQARARAGGSKGNKGEEAALALLEMCEVAAALQGRA
jgi:6,7-dimethyl-8-ribityllumazine synthase